MKANQKFRNDRAEVGVGTLIVFIAMVLVAAVAAAVLINTTGSLQQRASATGKEATQEVSSNLKVVNVYGVVTAGAVDELRIVAQLASGALPMDLEELVIRYSDGEDSYNLVWTPAYDDAGACDGAGTIETTTDDANFISLWVRPTATGANDLGCADKSVMEAGDLVEFRFTLSNGIEERTPVEISMIPETGSAVSADFKSPPTYGDDTVVTLR